MSVTKKGTSASQTISKKTSCLECSMPKALIGKTMSAKPNLPKTSPQKQSKTRIFVKCDCGFGNKLFIRGEGISTLSWDKGLPMTNTTSSEWVYETDRPFSVAQFKILLNDSAFENGENHTIGYGKDTSVTPTF